MFLYREEANASKHLAYLVCFCFVLIYNGGEEDPFVFERKLGNFNIQPFEGRCWVSQAAARC